MASAPYRRRPHRSGASPRVGALGLHHHRNLRCHIVVASSSSAGMSQLSRPLSIFPLLPRAAGRLSHLGSPGCFRLPFPPEPSGVPAMPVNSCVPGVAPLDPPLTPMASVAPLADQWVTVVEASGSAHWTLAHFPLPETVASMTWKLFHSEGRLYALVAPDWPFPFPFPAKQIISRPCALFAFPC